MEAIRKMKEKARESSKEGEQCVLMMSKKGETGQNRNNTKKYKKEIRIRVVIALVRASMEL